MKRWEVNGILTVTLLMEILINYLIMPRILDAIDPTFKEKSVDCFVHDTVTL